MLFKTLYLVHLHEMLSIFQIDINFLALKIETENHKLLDYNKHGLWPGSSSHVFYAIFRNNSYRG